MNYKRSIFTLTLLCSTLVVCMEEAKTSRCESVERFFLNVPQHLPKYVFENCNQVTRYNWSQEVFQQLKRKVAGATREKLHRLYTNKKDFVKHAEGYDWIHGLNYLESEYLIAGKDLTQHLTIQEIKKINGLFSRLIADEPGEFREREIVWIKRPLTNAENSFYIFLDKIGPENLRTGNNAYNLKTDDGNNVDANGIRRLLSFCKKNKYLTTPTDIIYNSDNSPLDDQEVDNWLIEQRSLVEQGKKKKNQINLVDWFDKRCHHFPPVDEIEPQLSTALEKIKDPAMHPIEKAAYVWYELVRIHISHEANKRTGKALASVILFQNGYLPPLITAEDEKRYLDTFINGFDSDKGYEQFLDFVIDMIIKTQKIFEEAALM